MRHRAKVLRQRSRFVCIMPIVVALSAATGWVAEPEKAFYVSIFDGKTLNGWDGDPRYWHVENGTILGQTTKDNPLENNTFLIWRGGDVADFELMLEYRIVGGNSGIQYRSWEDPEKWGKWVVGGYQADIDIDSLRKPGWSGICYEERGRQFLAKHGQKTVIADDHKPRIVGVFGDPVELQSHIRSEDWNTYHIIAKGHHFIQKINGHMMIETTDNDKSARRESGLLALQLHQGDPMKIQFRRVRIKRYD